MKINLRLALVLGGAALLQACASYPTSETGQGDKPSGLVFRDAPPSAVIMLDGAPAGEAASYDGKHAYLQVSPGTHQVRVTVGGAVIYDKPVYVGASNKVEVRVNP